MIELIISIGLLAVIILAVTAFGRAGYRLQSFLSSSLNAVDEGRRLLRPMANEIRSAGPSAQGAYALETVDASELVFFSDVTNDGFSERIRYFLDDDDLKRGEISPEGSPLEYSGSETIDTLMRNVTDLSFSYYDENYNGVTGSPLSAPVSPVDVRLINISITIDDDLNREPNPLGVVETNVSVRNLKDNL